MYDVLYEDAFFMIVAMFSQMIWIEQTLYHL